MTAITHIAPAIAGFFFTAFIVSMAGITAPLAYFFGFLIVLMLGVTLAQLAKHLPSAGGYYTYVSRALHPRAGFITSWMYILYSPLVGGPLAGFFGYIVAGELSANWGIEVPWLWAVSVLVFSVLTAFLQWEGIKLSVKFVVDHRRPGDGHRPRPCASSVSLNPPAGTSISLDVFNPAMIPAGGAFLLAVVLTVQGLTGWEASAPFAEETKDPKRNVPRSVIALDRPHRQLPGRRLLGRHHGLRERRRRDRELTRAAGTRRWRTGSGATSGGSSCWPS